MPLQQPYRHCLGRNEQHDRVGEGSAKFIQVIQQKLPMFCGQIYKHKYLNDPVVSICAVGDATCDIAPLQVTKFAQGK